MHKLYHGDYATILKNVSANLILTSPPYNIGSKSPKRITNRKNGGYDSKSWGAIENYPDSLPESDYQLKQKEFLIWASNAIVKNGSIAYNHKLRHMKGNIISPTSWFPDCLTWYDRVVWDRGSTHNHCQNYVYQHDELVYLLGLPKEKRFFNRTGDSSIWRINPDRSNSHNAPFPLSLAIRIIERWCPEGGLVCDPYSGSGTVMLACKISGRNFVGAEKNKKYYSESLKRMGKYGNSSTRTR